MMEAGQYTDALQHADEAIVTSTDGGVAIDGNTTLWYV